MTACLPFLLCVTCLAGQPPVESTDAVANQRQCIDGLIQQLGDPSYERRSAASRELCRIGHAAAPQLEGAAKGSAPEIAIRAQELLEVIRGLCFGGCEVQVGVSPERIKWNQPAILTVTIRNSSSYPARIPLLPRPSDPGKVDRIGDMIDLADFLRVTGPDGEPIDLRVDDIRDDPDVAAAMQMRAEHAPSFLLPPDESVAVRLEGFNRSWARFPLLSEGPHHVRLDYQPAWDDPDFLQGDVGRVRSDPASIEVTAPAPPEVRTARRQAVVSLERKEDAIVASIQNTYDLPIWLNLNMGQPTPPFSTLRWWLECGDVEEEFPFEVDPTLSFRMDRLKKFEPGERLALGRLPLKQVQAVLAKLDPPPGIGCKIRAAWTNLADAAWQRTAKRNHKAGDGPIPEGTFPPRTITGRYAGEPIQVDD